MRRINVKHYIGIDIGGTNIKYGLLTEEGQVLDFNKIKTNRNKKEMIQSIKGIVEKYQQNQDIVAVGVSAPGIVQADGFMVTGGAIQDFYGINLKEELMTALELQVAVENDANCAALAEKWIGASKDNHHSVTIVVGTGIGGGVIINDELFRGAHATAGEFGFMLVEEIENNDSRMATLSLTGAVGAGVVDKYQQQLADGTMKLSGLEIFNLAEQGDSLAISVIDRFYDRLAKGIFNMAVSFDPEVILIGGEISGNQEFMFELRARVARLKVMHRDMQPVILPDIRPCQFLNQAGVIGATYNVMKRLAE